MRIVGDRTDTVAVSDSSVGDLVLITPGASIPADGVVQDRTTDVNESMITGESRPVRKERWRDCRNREWIRITAGSIRICLDVRAQRREPRSRRTVTYRLTSLCHIHACALTFGVSPPAG